MYQELSQLSESKSGRILLAIAILTFVYYSFVIDLLRGPESLSWWFVDVAGLVIFGLLTITSLWPRAGEILSQLEEEYAVYLSLAVAIFFFFWASLLVWTRSDEFIFLIISFGGGLASVLTLLWRLFFRNGSASTS